MTPFGQSTALQVNGEEISLADVIHSAAWRGQLQFLETAADNALIRSEAAQRGLQASDEELQEAADEFRAARRLYEAEDLEKWLIANHFSVEDWERLLEEDILIRKVRDAVTEREVEQYFAENKLSFDAATISQIVVGAEEVAKELIIQISDEGADFHKLARRHSMDDATRPASGYVGPVRRKTCPPTRRPRFSAPGPVTLSGR